MTEGVERDIADDSERGMDFWGFAEGGSRRRPRGQKHQAGCGKALKNRDNGGEAAGPRLKSVGCGKVNGGFVGWT